ncbi:MAG: carbon-nitrogen hydrolase family protein [Chloroflexi bacterium]|nr:carbon-nitrogen hydrolase family protein [Chloroflexota bacterium]OQB01126.1 MAG: (R)-stereoselective amidase [Chloroflexi bacterium ADurb.Bin222]HOC19918.1 carbon-nitrogen hydrolase family protein [Anaerolineae bacterium]HOS78638.1 carbon-nitrogen hydrolase family protein [Anaerolineae bacterium]HQJ11505.1 carbon-nitrogen hydrolase family protein [Anaerolineae bacterium]
MRELNIAVVQMAPELGKMEANIARMADWIRIIATAQPVDIIVFPELSVTGYEGGQRFAQMAQRVPGAASNILGQHASEFGVYVLVGMATKEKVESVIYNSAVLIGPDGAPAGEYRKLHLPAEERLVFRPGYRLAPVETEFGVIGILLGWDLVFPEVARNLVLDGAEVLLLPAAWEARQAAIWRTLLVARAYENEVFLAAANRIGQEPSYTFGGESAILGPRGEMLGTIAPPEEGEVGPTEGYVVARLDLDEIRRRREESQIISARQPAAYRAIVRKY